MQQEIRPIHKLTYRLKLTPQMRLSMNLLQMPLVKLKEFVKQQVEENPLLEAEDLEPLPETKEKLEEYPTDEEKQSYKESLITHPATLEEHLLRQLHLLTGSDHDRKIGELIIGNIDDNGYLKSSVEDIAGSAGTTTYKVEKVLFLIQTFDPVGVGARDLRECLLLQLKAKGEENSPSYQIADKYLPYLEKKRYNYIASKLKVSVKRIKESAKEITGLEPKPGRSFNIERTVYLIPDVILKKDRQGYKVIFNTSELPQLTLNEKYKEMIKQKETPEDAREYLRERVKAARSLIDAVNKRKETIQKVTETVVSIQKDSLDEGVTNLKPMTLDQIANKVGKHKSTVCRAISNKYLQTPWGIVELRYFLSYGVKQETGEYLSSKAIKSKIADLIAKEKKSRPLSDQKIVELLKKEGIFISRRTVTKYREQLKILSSQSRRE